VAHRLEAYATHSSPARFFIVGFDTGDLQLTFADIAWKILVGLLVSPLPFGEFRTS
jgi:hypothetical protein